MTLSTLEWAHERLDNTARIAAEKTAADREGWLEDGRYWQAIVDALSAADGLPPDVAVELARQANRFQEQRDSLLRAWALSWDCSRDPGHVIMNTVVAEITAEIEP